MKLFLVAGLLSALVLATALLTRANAKQNAGSPTVPLQASFHVVWGQSRCPKGTPVLTPSGSIVPCYRKIGRGNVAGFGPATVEYTLVVWNVDTSCERWRFRAALTVFRKGSIFTTAHGKGCFSPDQTQREFVFTATGGSGAFSGASGRGTISIKHVSRDPSGRGTETETWSGRLSVRP